MGEKGNCVETELWEREEFWEKQEHWGQKQRAVGETKSFRRLRDFHKRTENLKKER